MDDTVYALSTPVGGALAVIRISGPAAKHILERVFTGRVAPRYAAYGHIVDGASRIDEAIAVYYPAPGSYTGEAMAELSLHGGRAVVRETLALLSRYARAAQPGEFTKRAFLNGKIDLSQAEAVMDVITANASRSARAAMEQLSGLLSERILKFENTLLDALSGLDAAIDYPEEMEEDVFSHLPTVITSAAAELSDMVDEGLRAKVLREGALIAIAGRPNAGKSSLMNALLGTDRAIVADVAGTTRDVIEEETVIAGIPARLADTAGIRDTSDAVERMGVERAKALIERADLIILTFDGGSPLTPEDDALVAFTADYPRLAVLTKTDLDLSTTERDILTRYKLRPLPVSTLTGEGMDALTDELAVRIAAFESALVTNSRHIEALSRARDALASALDSGEPDCMATDVREALSALGSITGRVVDDDVVDRIFERFCVGK